MRTWQFVASQIDPVRILARRLRASVTGFATGRGYWLLTIAVAGAIGGFAVAGAEIALAFAAGASLLGLCLLCRGRARAFFVALALTAVAWGLVRVPSPPRRLPGLGVIAQIGTIKRGALVNNAKPGSSQDGTCHQCGTVLTNAENIVRSTPGDGLRVDTVVRTHASFFSCGRANVNVVISGTPGFWREHQQLFRAVQTRVAIGWNDATRLEAPADESAREASALHEKSFLAAWIPDEPTLSEQPAYPTDVDLQLAPKSAKAGRSDARAIQAATSTKEASETEPEVSHFRMFSLGSSPVGAVTQVYAWGSTTRGYDVHDFSLYLHFWANWTRQRGIGSCYVELPNLLSNGSEQPTVNALHALMRSSAAPKDTWTSPAEKKAFDMWSELQPPSDGRTSLVTNGTIATGDSDPAPQQSSTVLVGIGNNTLSKDAQLAGAGRSTPLGETWTCTPRDDLRIGVEHGPDGIPPSENFNGSACGAIAVVDAPGAETARNMLLLVISALLALCVERLFHRDNRQGETLAGDPTTPQTPTPSLPEPGARSPGAVGTREPPRRS